MTPTTKLIAFSGALLFSITLSDLGAMNPNGTWTPENFGQPSTDAPQHQADIDAASAAQENGSGQARSVVTINVPLDTTLVEACVQSIFEALDNRNVPFSQLPTIDLSLVILGRPEVKAKLDAIVDAIPQATRTIIGTETTIVIAIESVKKCFNLKINRMVQLMCLQQALRR